MFLVLLKLKNTTCYLVSFFVDMTSKLFFQDPTCIYVSTRSTYLRLCTVVIICSAHDTLITLCQNCREFNPQTYNLISQYIDIYKACKIIYIMIFKCQHQGLGCFFAHFQQMVKVLSSLKFYSFFLLLIYSILSVHLAPQPVLEMIP